MSNDKTKPLLLSLQKVAREVGVNPDTIEKHQDDFFPVLLLGEKRYVPTAAYAAWLRTRLGQAVPDAAAA
jgi:hypothetical protein